MSDLTVKPTPKQIQDAQRRYSCQMGLHFWRKTFVAGEFLCQSCGIYAYCPGCTPVYPSMYLHACPAHRGGRK